ncbi:MAG: exodeoxyribonuclease V subunit gamma [Ignavibacteria bacterium]|nr:exodeoxyribonuclease V subunit gamma [Ignavibacteria bacterium]
MILTPLDNFKGFDLDNWLFDNKDRTDDTGLLLLLPTKRRQREFKKFLAKNYPGLKIKTDTIRDLARKIGGKIDPGFRIIPDEILEVFVRQIINDLNDPDFSQNLTNGMIRLIKNTISEFKENGTNADSLILEINNLNPVNKDKALFLSRVFSALDIRLKSSGMKEIGDIYLMIQTNSQLVPSAFSSVYPDVKEVFMQNFMELTSPEIALVEGIAKQTGNRVYIDFDYSIGNPFLFEKLQKCFNSLEKAGFRSHKSSTESVLEFHTRLKENLFKPVKPGITKVDNIFEIQAPTLYDETNFVAKEIKNLLLTDKSLQTAEIGVIFHRIPAYTPFIRAAFESQGIPTNITDRFRTGDFSPVSGLLDLLRVISHNFSFDSVFRVLSNPVLQKRYGNSTHFKRGCSHIKVTSGYDKMVKFFSLEIQKYQGYTGEEEEFDDTSIISSLKSSLVTIQKLWGDLESLTLDMEPLVFFKKLKKLVKDTGLLTAYVSDTGSAALFNIRALSTFLSSASFLFNVLQQYENRKRNYEEYLEMLLDLSQETRFNLVEQPETGVMITTPDEARGLKFKHLFICALNDGDFPTRYRAEIFKYDGVTEQIKKHSAEERLLFYQALSAWRGPDQGRLYLTNSKKAGKQAKVESFFKSDFKTLFTVTSVDIKNYEQKIYSKRDIFSSWHQFDNKTAVVALEKSSLINQFDIEELKQRSNDYLAQSNLAGSENSPFAGYISFDETEETPLSLPVLRRVNTPFSATSLESYARCPYQFFAKYILGTEADEEISEELDSLEFGTLLHSILRAFHSELLEQNKKISDCTDAELEEYLNRLIDIAKNIEDHNLTELLDTESFLSAEKILGIAGNSTWSILYKYLEVARNNSNTFLPALFESNFGGLKLTGRNSEERRAPYEIKIKGRIDRIDVDETNRLFKVIDYKSGGKKYPEPEVREGKRLQLPLYLIAADKGKIKDLPEDFSYLFPQIFSLKYNENDFGAKDIHFSSGKVPDTRENAKAKWEELLQITETNIQTFVLNILEGKFNLTSDSDRDNKNCQYCNLKPLCRVKEHKI